MCVCGHLRELAAGINWKGQSTITGRQAGVGMEVVVGEV